jgi:hypothetical protein
VISQHFPFLAADIAEPAIRAELARTGRLGPPVGVEDTRSSR